jgi:hypothetical protein
MDEAVASYQRALDVYEREGDAEGWASSQDALARALEMQGGRIGGKEGLKLLMEATAAQRRGAATLRAEKSTPEVIAQAYTSLAVREPQIMARALLLEIARLLVSGQVDPIVGKLEELRSVLVRQPPGPFQIRVTDIQGFIERDEPLASFRAQLRELFAVGDSGDRDAMIAALDALIARYRASQSPATGQ